jgi:hypothetical protein
MRRLGSAQVEWQNGGKYGEWRGVPLPMEGSDTEIVLRFEGGPSAAVKRGPPSKDEAALSDRQAMLHARLETRSSASTKDRDLRRRLLQNECGALIGLA